MTFAEATAVKGDGEHRYSAQIEEGWDILGVANGGYLMTIASRAMAAGVTDRKLVSVTGHFMNPASAGPVQIEVEPLKSGRMFATLRAVMTADGKPLLTATGSFSTGNRSDPGTTLILGSPPDIPPPDECERAVSSETGPFPPPFVDQVDLRVHPEDAGAVHGRPSGSAAFRGWFRLPDGEKLDDLAIVLASDAFPPAVFNAGQPMAWTPTLDLTVQVRDPGPHDWLLCKFQTRFITGGFLEEDGEIWDADGNLVALSRQLALVGR